MDNYYDFLQRCAQLEVNIRNNYNDILRLLGHYETYATAHDELTRSLSTLKGAKQEFYQLDIVITGLSIATFFPQNLPLYSLILFAVMPGAFGQHCFVRAPQIMQQVLSELVDILDLKTIFPNIRIKNVARRVFMKLYASNADVVIFTGRYENALQVQSQCPRALFLFNGGGTNPAVVFDDADIALAAAKLFEMRTFNSGQDCAGTDVIFVHETCLEAFTRELEKHCNTVVVSPQYGNTATTIGPILKREYISKLTNFLAAEQPYIVRHGTVNTDNSVVEPIIVRKKIGQHYGDFHEFFAPVFYILSFASDTELHQQLAAPDVMDYSMYLTCFGTNIPFQSHYGSRLLHNVIINDVEDGNLAYGGYGKKANFAAYGHKRIIRPILISREIHDFYKNDGLNAFSDRDIEQSQTVTNDDFISSM